MLSKSAICGGEGASDRGKSAENEVSTGAERMLADDGKTSILPCFRQMPAVDNVDTVVAVYKVVVLGRPLMHRIVTGMRCVILQLVSVPVGKSLEADLKEKAEKIIFRRVFMMGFAT